MIYFVSTMKAKQAFLVVNARDSYFIGTMDSVLKLHAA